MGTPAHGRSVLARADWVAAHLDDPDVRVVEVDVSSAAYDEGHIQGAILWDAYKDLRHPDFSPIDKAEFEAVLARDGPDTRHDRRLLRIRAGARLLAPGSSWPRANEDLGWSARAVGGGGAVRWSTDVPEPDPTSYLSEGGRVGSLASTNEVRDAIEDPDTVILDVRSPEEFRGEQFWPSGATEDVGRAGHIPGSDSRPGIRPDRR